MKSMNFKFGNNIYQISIEDIPNAENFHYLSHAMYKGCLITSGDFFDDVKMNLYELKDNDLDWSSVQLLKKKNTVLFTGNVCYIGSTRYAYWAEFLYKNRLVYENIYFLENLLKHKYIKIVKC